MSATLGRTADWLERAPIGAASERRRRVAEREPSATRTTADAAPRLEQTVGAGHRPRGPRPAATATKLFCGCANRFGGAPNTHVCPVCLGHPGRAAGPERRGGRAAIRVGLALGCEIADARRVRPQELLLSGPTRRATRSRQYDRPLCDGGELDVPDADGGVDVGIVRAHLEEDAGKMRPRARRRIAGATAPGRPQPRRRAADRDRHRARPATRPSRRSRFLAAAARDDRRPRRLRLRHGEGHAALRRQRVGAPGGHDRARHARPRSRT